MRLPIVALLLGLAFLAGLRTQAILAPAQAAAAASPQVYHIAPTDTYPKLAQGIWGKVFGHSPSGDIEVVDSPRHPTTYT